MFFKLEGAKGFSLGCNYRSSCHFRLPHLLEFLRLLHRISFVRGLLRLSTKGNANGQCLEASGEGRQLPLSFLIATLLPGRDNGVRPCEQLTHGTAVALL